MDDRDPVQFLDSIKQMIAAMLGSEIAEQQMKGLYEKYVYSKVQGPPEYKP
jgi:hypothetical protein